MAIFNSYVKLPEGISIKYIPQMSIESIHTAFWGRDLWIIPKLLPVALYKNGWFMDLIRVGL